EGGERFVYLRAGSTENDAGAVIAYSPVDRNGRAVLFGDGSVAQLSARQFEEALQRGGMTPGELAAVHAAPTALTSVPMLGAAVPGGLGGAVRPIVPQVNPPAAHGLRSLRIDLPRTGQKFTFTKVLKLTDEPLPVRALAVAAKTLYAVRGASQVGVFVAGVLLLWWQLRRAAPRSLVVTFALAMILGSVGHLLLTNRLLGTVMVIGVPMLLVALIVSLARRYLLRRPVLPGSEPAGPSSPTPSPGLGPAMAAITLLLSVASTDAKEMDSAVQSPITSLEPPVECVFIRSATYTGTVHERVARLEAVIQVAASKAGRTFKLFGEDVAVEEFSPTPASVRLLRQGNSISVRLPDNREALLRVKFLVKLSGDVTRRHLAFAIPPALSSKLALTVDEPEAAVEFPSAVWYHSFASGQQTRVEAVIGAGERVELQWAPRVKRAAEIAATVCCRNASLVSFTGGVMSLRSQLDYQVTQGELREARVRLPAGHRFLRVEGESIRTWQVKDDGASQILTVELLKGISPGYRLAVETERTIDTLPGDFAVETLRPLDVKRESGFVALHGSDELGLTVETVQGLQKVDTSEFLKVTPQTIALAAAYQFLKPDFAMTVRVEALQPQVEAVVSNRVRIGAEQIQIIGKVDYVVKRAGVFALRLALPKDFRVESVTGNEIAH